MPNPTPASVHVDTLLTNISIAYKNPAYIADELCPLVTVNKQTDIIPKYDQSHWFRDAAARRAPGTKSRRGGFTVDKTDTYRCERFSWGFELPDELRDNADEPFNLDRDATNFVTEKILMRREVGFSVDLFATGVWGTDKLGGVDFTKWSDYGTSTPLFDIEAFKDAMEGTVAREPNKFILGKQAWVSLKWHPDLLDTIKYTQRAQMTVELFAALIELEKVFIGRAIRVTSAQGVAESAATYVRIWGKNGLFLYTPPAASLLVPSACYTFTWNRVANSIQYIKRMRDEEAEIDIIESNSYFDQKVTAKNAGLFVSAAVV